MFVFCIFVYNSCFFNVVFQIIEKKYLLTVTYQSLLMNFVSTMTFEQGVAVYSVSKH